MTCFTSYFRSPIFLLLVGMAMLPGFANGKIDDSQIKFRSINYQTVVIEMINNSYQKIIEIDVVSETAVKIEGISSNEESILVLGTFHGSLEISNQKVTSTDSDSFLVAAFDYFGDILWIQTFQSLMFSDSRIINVGSPFSVEQITENELPVNDPDDHGPNG